MIKLFVERNLLKTVHFLTKIGIKSECSLTFDSKDLFAISSQNISKFYNAYTSLLCPFSKLHLNFVVFCNCCSSRKNFLRNYSLIMEYPASFIKCKDFDHRKDPFLRFIEAKVQKDRTLAIEMLKEIIMELPLFWDAYLLLCDLTQEFINLDQYSNSKNTSGTPISLVPYFYLQLKIAKDLDPPSISLSFIKSNAFDIRSLPYNIDVLDINSKAALNYCYGNQSLALKLFKSIDFCNSFDTTYFELFGMLIYNTNDTSLQVLCENMNNYFKFIPETYVLVGLYRLSTNNCNEAVKLFKKAIKKIKTSSPTHCLSDVYCLLAYSYIKINEYGHAIAEYQEALKISSKNFRIFYSVAQGYFSMSKVETSLWYCKKALDIRGDGSIYKLMGRIYMMLNNPEVALSYFETSLLHEEVDSLLYMADAYRKKGEMKKALVYYEKYVEQGQKNVKVVVKYLVDYYEEHGDEEKLKYFREALKMHNK